MKREFLFFTGTDESNNRDAEELLNKLPDADIQFVSGSTVLEGRVLMPFIETRQGSRHYGIESIEAFVDKELSKTA